MFCFMKLSKSLYRKKHIAVSYDKIASKRLYQKQPSRCVLKKRCPENMQQRYRRTHMPKCVINVLCSFIEIILQHECSPLNLLHIFRTTFFKNSSGRLLLFFVCLKHLSLQDPYNCNFLTLATWLVPNLSLCVEVGVHIT